MITVLVYEKKKKALLKNIKITELDGYIHNKSYVVWADVQDPSNDDYETLKQVFKFKSQTIDEFKASIPVPKIDEFEDYVFITFHRVVYDEKKEDMAVKEIDFCVSKNYLVSLHEGSSTSIKKMIDKIYTRPSVMDLGADVIMYSIMETLTEKYILLGNYLSNEIEKIEDKVISKKTTKGIMQKIMKLKRTISEFKRSILPQREIISRLARREYSFISERAGIYCIDILENLAWLHANLESDREIITSIFDASISLTSNKMNEASTKLNKTMQRLTIIATIFMPLTFITGIYGMNFQHMPELEWDVGYFVALGIMITIAFMMIAYFKRKRYFQ